MIQEQPNKTTAEKVEQIMKTLKQSGVEIREQDYPVVVSILYKVVKEAESNRS